MQGFKDYHKIIRTHSGTGQLSLHGGDEMQGFFSFVQYADGSMRLDCLVAPNGILQVAPERETPILVGTPGSFTGQTEEGLFVQTDAAFVIGIRFGMDAWRGIEGAPRLAGEGYVHMEFGLALEVTGAAIGYEGNQSFRLLRYGLTNLAFDPSDFGSVSTSNPPIAAAPHLPLDLGAMKVGLQPIAKYKEIIGALAFTHDVDVTAELILPVESLESFSEMEPVEFLLELDRKVDDLCTLLTLATGTRVNRYGLDFVDKDEKVNTSFLHHAVTARYKPHPFPAPVSRENLKSFVEDGFPKLAGADEQWGLRSVVDSYIDARDSNLLTATGVKLSVCVEILKAGYLKRAKLKDFFVPEKLFERALKKHDLRGKLRAALRETLGAARPAPGSHNPLESAQVVLSDEELDAAIDAMVKDAKPKELNRRSFGDVLRKMCAEVGMEASDEERGRFVKIRNHLVHQGVFLESLGEPDQQCRFLDNFVGRFLLAALGYVVPIEPNGESSHDEADASAPSEHPA